MVYEFIHVPDQRYKDNYSILDYKHNIPVLKALQLLCKCRFSSLDVVYYHLIVTEAFNM